MFSNAELFTDYIIDSCLDKRSCDKHEVGTVAVVNFSIRSVRAMFTPICIK